MTRAQGTTPKATGWRRSVALGRSKPVLGRALRRRRGGQVISFGATVAAGCDAPASPCPALCSRPDESLCGFRPREGCKARCEETRYRFGEAKDCQEEIDAVLLCEILSPSICGPGDNVIGGDPAGCWRTMSDAYAKNCDGVIQE
jgi:hypothetical protein